MGTINGTFRGSFPEKMSRKNFKNQWKKTFNEVPELFARVVPWRMQIFSLADDQEGHFQAICGLQIVLKNPQTKIFDGTQPPILAPKPSQKLSLRLNVLTFSALFTYTAPKTGERLWLLDP